MIRFTCECGQQLQARDEHAGKVIVCPKCKNQTRVPELPATSIQPEEPPEQAPPRARVQRERPALRDEPNEEETRPRRQRESASSGKALASLVLGILSFCGCSCLTGLPAVVLGILSLLDISKAAGTLTGKPMAVIGILLSTIGTLCLPFGYYFGFQAGLSRVRESASKVTSINNLRQMSLAMLNYHDTQGRFPPPGVSGPNQPLPGRPQPRLSWRVALLPYLGRNDLYSRFNFNESWDGPTNSKLLTEMPSVYKIPGDEIQPGYTRYQVFVGNGAAFDANMLQPLSIASFTDGTSNTILIVEAEKPVPWTKPEDIPYEPGKPIRPLLSTHFRGGCNIVMADGSPRVVTSDVPESTLHAAITRGAGDFPNWP
jgi:hypothetical protein